MKAFYVYRKERITYMENKNKRELPDISFKKESTLNLNDSVQDLVEPEKEEILKTVDSDSDAEENLSAYDDGAKALNSADSQESVNDMESFVSEAQAESAAKDSGGFSLKIGSDDIDKAFAKEQMEAQEAKRESLEKSQKAKKAKKANKKKPAKKKSLFNFSVISGITITIVLVSVSIVIATGGIMLGMEYLGINKNEQDITFNIPEGSSTDEIIQLLIDNGIIENKTLFKAIMRINDSPSLYPGDITLSPNMSYLEILNELSTMRESYETVTLTFSEGSSLYAIANKLEKYGVCTAEDFLFQFNSEQDFEIDANVTRNSDTYYAMEGFFFPDTYEFYVDDSAYNVTKIVRENMSSKITSDMYERMEEIGMTLSEVITLASIVQKEAGFAEDMPGIAAVFYNRLESDEYPYLQSDATGIYVTSYISKTETSTTMLDFYSEVYDTYVCEGLPAGPICNPGLDAINAVLYPDDNDYYFFCTDPETYECYYAETYEEHQENLELLGLSE